MSLKHMAVLCLIFVILGVVAVWGLNSLTYRGESSPVEVETTYGPVKLTMKLEKTTYELGEPVSVTLTITNISNETTLLYFTIPCKTNFIILNKLSKTIYDYFRTHGWADTTYDLVLDSGESSTQTLTWTQLEVDDFPPFDSRQVQSGTYYIIGQIGPPLTYVGPPEEFDPEHGCPTIETSKVEINII